MILTIFGIICLIGIYLIGKFFHKKMIGPIIIGIIIGFFFEIIEMPMFLYDIQKLTLYFTINNENIPIAIIFAWGCVLSTVYLLTRISQDLTSKNKNIHYFCYGLLFLGLVTIPLEFIGFYVGLWQYSCVENITTIWGVPWTAIIGWFFFGIVFISTIKLYEKEIKKIF